MKLKDINKIKEVIGQRLDDSYEINAEWNQKEAYGGKVWEHKDDVFDIRVYYWTKRENNRGNWSNVPVVDRSATVVLGFEDRHGNDIERSVIINIDEEIDIPEENIHSSKISTSTRLRVGNHHLADYTKRFYVKNRNSNLDDATDSGRGYMKLIWEIFDGQG